MSSKKETKKHLKNIHRCLRHLSCLVGFECHISENPSTTILFGNAGHANNIGKSDLMSYLKNCNFHQMDFKVYFPAGKQFSLLTSDSVIAASDLLEINGCLLKNNKIYCSFIQEKLDFEEFAHGLVPPGLKVLEEIVTKETELHLLKYFMTEIDSNVQHTSQDSLKNRRTLHFGYKFDYSTNRVDLQAPLENPIPLVVQEVIRSIKPRIRIKPNQLTVNIYQPGQGIPKHVDTHSVFTTEVLSISLGSSTIMDFKNPSSGKILPVLIPERSLTIMSGESRYLWHHGITPRKVDALDSDVVERKLRISLTLRECTSEPCKCSYPSQCDSQNFGKPLFHEQKASEIEQSFVSDVYEEIAEHFSNTRHSPWPGVVKFLDSIPSHSLVVDVGCGNGKYLGVRHDISTIGNDNSFNLCKISREKQHEVFSCNALSIPMRDSTFDAAICIAMLHHITTEQRRLQVLQNLASLLRPGGLCLVTVWAQEQHLDLDGTDTVKPCPTDSTDDGVGRRHFDSQDVFVDWRKPGAVSGKENTVFHRYYHVFKEGELDSLVAQVDDVEMVKVTYEKANWCVVFRKVS